MQFIQSNVDCRMKDRCSQGWVQRFSKKWSTTTASRSTAIFWSTCCHPWKITHKSFNRSWLRHPIPMVPSAQRVSARRRYRRWRRLSATRLRMPSAESAYETCRSNPRSLSRRFRRKRRSAEVKINLPTTINDQTLEASVYPNQTLLEFLRDDLSLKGSVEGCGV